VVELGDAALVLARKGDSGRLFLVLGEQVPRELPVTFALDAEGRSVDAIALDFTRTSSVVSVTALGQTVDFSVSPRLADEPLPMVLSAGGGMAWSIQRLVAKLITADPVVVPKTAVVVAVAVSNAPAGQDHGSAQPVLWDGMPNFATMPKASAVGTMNKDVSASAGKSSRNTLEIYTPPSIRQGRSKAIRAVVQGVTQN
jgi:hypothetical protein